MRKIYYRKEKESLSENKLKNMNLEEKVEKNGGKRMERRRRGMVEGWEEGGEKRL